MATDEYAYKALKNNNNSKTRLQFARGNHHRRWRIKWICLIVLAALFLITLFCFLTSKLILNQRDRGAVVKSQKLLLISLDGFRHDLRQKATTPHLDWIVNNGVSTDYVMNVFPTITIPNHQSIVTGLFPESHGLLGNKMYDRKTKQKFRMNDTNPLFWNDALPIWIENELQGYRSGNCFWPGYNVLFDGRQASYLPSSRYTSPLSDNTSQNMPWKERVDLSVDWLKNDDVTFVTLYIDEPDLIEHEVGPDPSNARDRAKLEAVIQKVDDTLGRVLRKVKEGGLQSHVNIIIMGKLWRLESTLKPYYDLALLDNTVNGGMGAGGGGCV